MVFCLILSCCFRIACDVAAVVVQDCAEKETAPADDFQIGEVGLPVLARSGCLVPDFIGCVLNRRLPRPDGQRR